MAAIVDAQNENDDACPAMATDLAASIPFQAALDLVFGGRTQANGYTEPALHRRRRQLKTAAE